MNHVLFAFLLTAIAGLSTGVGSIIAFFSKKTNTTFLSVSLGVSAGVMIYVSMIEIFPEANHKLASSLGDKQGMLITILSFFMGMLLIAIIEKLVPGDINPHIFDSGGNASHSEKDSRKLLRTGIFTALAISIHNFPEGMATFIAALHEPSVAIPIVAAIAIHNIPEGISVSVPIYFATGDKKKAFIYSFVSGLAEPVGAVIGYLLLMPVLNDVVLGVILAGVAGVMVFISFDELLPSAREYGEHRLSIYGLVLGMFIMAVSLYLFI